jgi:triosephosphate isomerase
VTPETAPELLEKSNIDGLLIGGASLDPHKFNQIIQGIQP